MPTGIWLYSYLVMWCLHIVVAVLLAAVIRQTIPLFSHWVQNDPSGGLPLGAPAPPLPTQDAYGRPTSLAGPRGKQTLLVFMTPGYSTCKNALHLIPAFAKAVEQNTEVVVVVGAPGVQTRLYVADLRPELALPNVRIVADPKKRLAERYQAVAVPYAVAVDRDERVGGKGLPGSSVHISNYLNQAEELWRRRHETGTDHATPLLLLDAVAAPKVVDAPVSTTDGR